MVTCLLLAAAVMLWPVRLRGWAPGRNPRLLATPDRDVLDSSGTTAGWAGGRPQRALILVGMGCGLWLILAVAGVVGLTVAAAILLTGTVLVRRAMADRRRRTALIDITGGLRILGRELRAGAEPSVAAANAGAAARGAGAEMLRGLARLTRADDRPSVGSGSAGYGGVAPQGSGDDRATTAAIGRGPAQLPDSPLAQAAARLRSGWLLTRRHGLAFTPLIDALAADLSEQIAADAERAGQVAGPRMSGYVMAVLPLLGLALGLGMGADPFRVLLLTPVGNILLLVGVLLTCTGLLWSARIVRH